MTEQNTAPALSVPPNYPQPQIKYPDLPALKRVALVIDEEEAEYGSLDHAPRWRLRQVARMCGTGAEVVAHVLNVRMIERMKQERDRNRSCP